MLVTGSELQEEHSTSAQSFCVVQGKVSTSFIDNMRASMVAQMVKNLRNAGKPSSILRLGRSPGEGNGNPLQYSGLENSTDRGAWQTIVQGVPKNRT